MYDFLKRTEEEKEDLTFCEEGFWLLGSPFTGVDLVQ